MQRKLKSSRIIALSLVLVLALAAPAWSACDGAKHRQFDFWLGEWDVENQKTGNVSVNLISSAHDGCVIREDYTAGSYTGVSLSFYDAKTGKWYQTWIDNQGQPLFLSGGLEDRKMVLGTDPDAGPIQRVTWTPNADGSVHQHWESSTGGEAWKTVFDGTYTKRKGK